MRGTYALASTCGPRIGKRERVLMRGLLFRSLFQFPDFFLVLCGFAYRFRFGDDEGFGGMQQKVSARELDDILANERTSPMVVDFYATWCGPCILLAQELEQVGHLLSGLFM